MTFKAFILRIIKSNLQKYSWFLISTIFSMTVFFNFINLNFTKSFQKVPIAQFKTLMTIAESVTVIFSVFIISYVHWHLMQERAKSFSVLLSYGMTRKALRKLITGETILIYFVSLCMAFITGSIFSKLFFLFSVKLLGLRSEDLEYQLTIESFLITAIVFAIIFTLVLVIFLIRISRIDLTQLLKSRGNVELDRKGHAWAGCLGLLLVGISVTALYQHNRESMKHTTQWILGSALVSLIGIYLIISHFSRIIYWRLKKNSKRYYGNLLFVAEFAKDYKQNRKTLFVLTLLTFGILFFVSITYSLYMGSYRFAESANPHDLYYQELDALPMMLDEATINNIFKESGTVPTETLSLPFIYILAPDMQIVNWRTWKRAAVVSETAYNDCFDSNYEVKPGETIEIIFDKLFEKASYLDDDIVLKNDKSEIQLRRIDLIYKAIINQYIFAQPFLLIVDDTDYELFENDAGAVEKGILHMYNFKNWTKSTKACNMFSDEFYDRFYDFYSGDNRSLVWDLIDRYGYSYMNIYSKTSTYESNKIQGSFSLYIMGFVSILFTFCIMNTLCFKVFLSGTEDSLRFKKLDGIGMTKAEKHKLITSRIKLIMLVPTLLGIVVELLWSNALNFKLLLEIDLTDAIITKNTAMLGGIYILIMILYYHILKNTYLKRLNL